jgi:amino acid permease
MVTFIAIYNIYIYSSKIAKINKVKTINIERELTELQNKKQASNREEIEKRINLLDYLIIEMC